jgi:hypothetical protein
MRSILNLHTRVHLAAETHYFDDLRAALRGKATNALDDDERRRCEDYFLALGHRPYGHRGDPEQGRHTRSRLRELADSLGDGADVYFEAFCRLEAAYAGKELFGEKTPRHVFRIREILERFPKSKVICMIRDPRAVIVSYRDWKNQGGFDFEKDPGHREELERDHERARQSYNLLLMSMLWRSTVGAAERAAREFGPERVRLVKYEDLARNPREHLSATCEWLGLPFEEAMLEAPMSNSSFARYELRSGVSTESIDRWRKKLSAVEVGIIQAVCRSAMNRMGYERDAVATPWLRLLWSWVTLPFAVVKAARLNRSRIGNLPSYVWRRLKLAMS